MALAAIIAGILTLAFVIFVWMIGRSSDKRDFSQQYTKATYIDNLKEHYGNAGLTLYGTIGDALDQKSGWLKTMDILFDVIDNNPHLLLEYLIECYGIDDLLDALSDYEGEAHKFSKGKRL